MLRAKNNVEKLDLCMMYKECCNSHAMYLC